MRLAVISYCHNEGDLMEAFVAHYKGLGADIYLFDNHSTDGSDELARSLGCHVQTYGSPDAFDSVEQTWVRSEAWKAYRDTHDLAIYADLDEFIVPVRPLSLDQPAIVRTRGFECFSEALPTTAPLESQPHLWNGVFSEPYSKPCVFNLRKLKSLRFAPGGHNIAASKPRYRHDPPEAGAPLLLHLRFVGSEQRILERFQLRGQRIEKGGDFTRGENGQYKIGASWALDKRNQTRQSAQPIPLAAHWRAQLGEAQLAWPQSKKSWF